MNKIASAGELQSELRRLLNEAVAPGVSRRAMAAELVALAGRVARDRPYPEQDVRGSGEWAVYFETEAPKTIHRWKFHTQAQATDEAKKAQKEQGGFVTVMRKGLDVVEVGPGGKVTKNATVLNVVARYVARQIPTIRTIADSSESWARTRDLRVNSTSLYQLS